MKKTCPSCGSPVSVRAGRCRRCGYQFPEGRGPRPVGLAMGVGFPLFLMGTLILFAQGTSPAVVILACAMVLVGLGLFFDPR